MNIYENPRTFKKIYENTPPSAHLQSHTNPPPNTKSIENPWHGKGFVEDLKPIILDLAPKLGDILVPELIKEIGSPDKILAYGKAGTVGLDGEIEHASAFIHTLRFGNKFRDAVG